MTIANNNVLYISKSLRQWTSNISLQKHDKWGDGYAN
jgi:hypothetical protein